MSHGTRPGTRHPRKINRTGLNDPQCLDQLTFEEFASPGSGGQRCQSIRNRKTAAPGTKGRFDSPYCNQNSAVDTEPLFQLAEFRSHSANHVPSFGNALRRKNSLQITAGGQRQFRLGGLPFRNFPNKGDGVPKPGKKQRIQPLQFGANQEPGKPAFEAGGHLPPRRVRRSLRRAGLRVLRRHGSSTGANLSVPERGSASKSLMRMRNPA